MMVQWVAVNGQDEVGNQFVEALSHPGISFKSNSNVLRTSPASSPELRSNESCARKVIFLYFIKMDILYISLYFIFLVLR